MGDKTLDALITMRQFYKKPRNVEEPTNDDECIFSNFIQKFYLFA